MSNPFYRTSGIISDAELYIGGKDNFAELQKCIDERRQTVIMGPKGCGKSSLLHTFFSPEYRMNAAKNQKILISPVSEFDPEFSATDIYNFLSDIIISSVKILDFCDKGEEMNKILRAFADDPCDSYEKAKTKFINALSSVSLCGYRIVFLIDSFEEFISSKQVTMEHHNVMRSCINKNQYIVATDHDLQMDSIPRGRKGSLYLQAFGGGITTVSGFSREETAEFISRKLAGEDISFSEGLIDKLHAISGGNPTILARAAGIAYDYLFENGTEQGLMLKDKLVTDSAIGHLFKNWCLMFTDKQIKCIEEIQNYNGLTLSEETKSAAALLVSRGFLKNKTQLNQRGVEREIPGHYEMSCMLYSALFSDIQAVTDIANSNPLRAVDEKVKSPIELLRELMNSEDFDLEQFIDAINEMLIEIPGVTQLVDMSEPISDTELGKYFITRQMFDGFDDRVRKYIEQGIKTCSVFRGTQIADFSPCIVLFCKAIEDHLNKTVVEVMKKAFVGYTVEYDGNVQTMDSITNTLMLGALHHILRQQSSTFGKKNYELLSDILTTNRISSVPSWKKYADTLFVVKDLRNDCPHCDPLTEEKSLKMLRTLFQGADSFIALNSRLYQDAKNKHYI